ncbi:hypothetical protein QQZ08_002720 [Neonectria magnoliae]|uniref:Uncharacterized protein n=1 Tax=Neonectria magnoliae TaxID=2732573 RepID=A0ABR1IAW3_9HYPO
MYSEESSNSTDDQDVQLKLKHPFIDYATSNWYYHINKSEVAEYDQGEFNVQLRKFLDNTK